MSGRKDTRRSKSIPPSEPRTSVVITVGWMLGAMATFGAELIGLVLKIVVWSSESLPDWLSSVTSVLFLIALVSGLFTLILTPVCLKVRPVPPPTPITVLVLTVATMPLLVLVARTLMG